MTAEQPGVVTISLWQPYASLIFTPSRTHAGMVKKHETRSFRLPHRLLGKRIAIHATAKFPPLHMMSEALHDLCLDIYGCNYNHSLPQGAILGTVVAADCRLADLHLRRGAEPDDVIAGDWAPGRWLWRLEDPRALAQPLPMKGRQGWWRCDLSAAGQSLSEASEDGSSPKNTDAKEPRP